MLWNDHQYHEECTTTTIWDARQRRVSAAPTCRYRGCNRACYQKAPEMYCEFCGLTHVDAHMSEACDKDMLQEPGLCGYKKCGLPGCNSLGAVESATQRVHDFCSTGHMLEYTTWITVENLKRGKLCQIEKCFRPVYVEENGRSHDFCGLKHSKLAAAAKGAGVNVLRSRQPEGSGEEINSNSNRDQDLGKRTITPENQECGGYRLPYCDDFGHTGFDGGIGDQQLKEYLISSQKKLLEELAHGTRTDSNPNKVDIFQGAEGAKFQHINIFQGADISKFHPWEVVTEPKPRYLLTLTSKNKVTRQTRDGWCWKQTGPSYPRKHSGLNSKYLCYKGKGVDSSGKRKKGSWMLHEFSLKDDDIVALAGQEGLEKSDRFRKAVILKMFRGDNSGPGRGEKDHPTIKLDSAISSREPSGGVVSDPNGQGQSSPAFDCSDPYYDVHLPDQHLGVEPSWFYSSWLNMEHVLAESITPLV